MWISWIVSERWERQWSVSSLREGVTASPMMSSQAEGIKEVGGLGSRPS